MSRPSFSRKTALRNLIAATAQALVPIGGPVLRRHFNNFEALQTELPIWEPLQRGARVFVLAPHPDDESLGVGGLIFRARQAGIEVQIGFLSNGDGSRTTQISQVLRRKNEKTLPDIARRRQDEALRAAHILGVGAENVLFFGFPDGGARALWDGDYSLQSPFVSPFTGYGSVECERAFAPHSPYCRAALLENLALAFEAFAPTLVLTTHPRDTHLDHVVAYRACEAAIASLATPHKPQLRAFLIHCGIWPVPNGLHPELALAPPAHLLRGGTQWFSIPLSDQEIAAKRAALECHQTQFGSTPRYLHAFVRRNELVAEIE